MGKHHHTNHGFGAVAGFAGLMIAVGVLVYEVGAGSIGLTSLTDHVMTQHSDATRESLRQGKMLVKSDQFGNCREFGLDNRTQEVVNRGVVVCDRARQEEYKAQQRSRFDGFRDAFGGPQR